MVFFDESDPQGRARRTHTAAAVSIASVPTHAEIRRSEEGCRCSGNDMSSLCHLSTVASVSIVRVKVMQAG